MFDRRSAIRNRNRWMVRGLIGLLTMIPMVQVHAAPDERDRQAILAMAGEYKVQFNFRETTPLMSGYVLKQPYQEHATEFVAIVEESTDRIVLQHVLVLENPDSQADEPEESNARVVKHWRQEWRYEPSWTWQYVGHNTWEHRPLGNDQRKGMWVQEVYQVDDSPRYASLGRWTHLPNDSGVLISQWEGEFTWRPLPRREWLKRNDYQVLVGRNRHTLTPTGWVHEQDNYKLVLDESGQPKQVLVREAGHNIYDRRGQGIAQNMATDFSPGYDYWARSSPFWSDVRQAWTERLSQPGRVRLVKRVNDKPLHRHMFEYASNLGESGYDPQAGRRFIQQVLESFQQTP